MVLKKVHTFITKDCQETNSLIGKLVNKGKENCHQQIQIAEKAGLKKKSGQIPSFFKTKCQEKIKS